MKYCLFWSFVALLIGWTWARLGAPRPKCRDLIHLAEGYRCTRQKSSHLLGTDWRVFSAVSKSQPSEEIAIRIRPDTLDHKMATAKTISMLGHLVHPSLPSSPKIFSGSGWLVRIDQGREGTPLSRFLRNRDGGELREKTVEVLGSLAEVVSYVNSQGFVLGCLTPDTIEVKQKERGLEVVLPDLDYSIASGQPLDPRGDWRYWEPARFQGPSQGGSFDPSVDAYSMGVTMYVLLHKGKFPFDVSDRTNYVSRIEEGRYSIDAGIQPEMALLMSQLMNKNPLQRPPARTVGHLCAQIASLKDAKNLAEPVALTSTESFPESLVGRSSPEFVRKLKEAVEEAKNAPPSTEKVPGEEWTPKLIAFWTFCGTTFVLFSVYFVWKVVKSESPEDSDKPLVEVRSMSAEERRRSQPLRVRAPVVRGDPKSLIRIEEAHRTETPAQVSEKRHHHSEPSDTPVDP